MNKLAKDLVDVLGQPKGGDPEPFKRWQRDNLLWTFPMFLIYVAPWIPYLLFDHWLIMFSISMILGIWKIRGEGRKFMGSALLGTMIFETVWKGYPNNEGAWYLTLWWVVCGYFTAYANAQDARRDGQRRDWEDK